MNAPATIADASDLIAMRDRELRGVAARFVTEARDAGRSIDMVAYGRECDRVRKFYDDMLPARSFTPLNEDRDDPVFASTTAAARYWGRI